MTSFSTYLIGFIVLIIGLALAAFLLNVPPTWIAVGVVVMLGIGILMATSRTKTKDMPTGGPYPPHPPQPPYPPQQPPYPPAGGTGTGRPPV